MRRPVLVVLIRGVAIGALFIKHICDLSDRETILQIQENIYMQYFIGFSSYSDEPVFDSSLFVDIRKRIAITITDVEPPSNKGELLVDATACPQDIKLPTDLNLLNDAREKSEELIDVLYAGPKQLDEKDKPLPIVR